MVAIAPYVMATAAILSGLRAVVAFRPLPRLAAPVRSLGATPRFPIHAVRSTAARELEQQRNLEIKRQLDEGSLVPVRVNVSQEFRQFLRLPKSKKSGRIFVPLDATASVDKLRTELEHQLGLPAAVVQVKAKCVSTSAVQEGQAADEESLEAASAELIADDDALRAALATAAQAGVMPKLLLSPDPEIEWPPVPEYMRGMPDPTTTTSMQMISFYSFYPTPDPEALCDAVRTAWEPLRVVGRVYVSNEGVNAQIAVPSNILPNFRAACASIPELEGVDLNLDLDIPNAEFNAFPPFRTLHVRPREQIVVDGLNEPLDLHDQTGIQLQPDEWHAALDNPDAVILDCRNTYESDIGRFEGAIPLNTTTFRDTWSKISDALEGKPKDTPVLTYCTGGIRCVKVGAYLEQRLGFANTYRLEGGIVNYTRHVRDVAESEGMPFDVVTKFKGSNYVFNDRMAELVTADIPNPDSDERRSIEALAMVAERAATGSGPGLGLATVAAGEGVTFGEQVPPALAWRPTDARHLDTNELDDYAARQSGAEPDLLQELTHATKVAMPKAAHMVSGHLQGRMLVMLTKLANAKRVLEVGTFTGYSALCFAEGLSEGGQVITLELDGNAASIAKRFFDRSPHGECIEIRQGNALELMNQMVDTREAAFDVVFLDADKRKYSTYLDTLLGSGLVRPGTLIIIDNVLWKGRVLGLSVSGPPSDVQGEDRATRRDRVLTQAMHELNVKVRKDPRVEQVVLPIRDGLSLIRVV